MLYCVVLCKSLQRHPLLYVSMFIRLDLLMLLYLSFSRPSSDFNELPPGFCASNIIGSSPRATWYLGVGGLTSTATSAPTAATAAATTTASSPLLTSVCAVKRLDVASAAQLEEMLREVADISVLRHPHVLPILAFSASFSSSSSSSSSACDTRRSGGSEVVVEGLGKAGGGGGGQGDKEAAGGSRSHPYTVGLLLFPGDQGELIVGGFAEGSSAAVAGLEEDDVLVEIGELPVETDASQALARLSGPLQSPVSVTVSRLVCRQPLLAGQGEGQEGVGCRAPGADAGGVADEGGGTGGREGGQGESRRLEEEFVRVVLMRDVALPGEEGEDGRQEREDGREGECPSLEGGGEGEGGGCATGEEGTIESVLRTGETGYLALVTPLCRRGNLEDYLNRRVGRRERRAGIADAAEAASSSSAPLPAWHFLLRCLAQAASALAHLHASSSSSHNAPLVHGGVTAAMWNSFLVFLRGKLSRST